MRNRGRETKTLYSEDHVKCKIVIIMLTQADFEIEEIGVYVNTISHKRGDLVLNRRNEIVGLSKNLRIIQKF